MTKSRTSDRGRTTEVIRILLNRISSQRSTLRPRRTHTRRANRSDPRPPLFANATSKSGAVRSEKRHGEWAQSIGLVRGDGVGERTSRSSRWRVVTGRYTRATRSCGWIGRDKDSGTFGCIEGKCSLRNCSRLWWKRGTLLPIAIGSWELETLKIVV